MKKDTKILLILSILVILIIAVILIIKQRPNIIDENVMKCIASKSSIYSSSICSHCKQQEEILGNYYNLFNVTDCLQEKEVCLNAQIEYTPTWIINNKKYIGVKSIKELKDLTGC